MKIQFDLLKQKCYDTEIEDFFTNMPLLEEFIRIKVFNKSFLNDVTVLFIQHHLSPLIGRLEAMKNNGMLSKNTWFVDIPYSTNEEVKQKIRKKYTTHKYPDPYSDPKNDYNKAQLQRTKTTIAKIIKSKPKKLLVVDDGAYFIRAVHELYIENNEIAKILYNSTYIVEQTTRGHRYLNDLKYSAIIKILNIPIVSIARCKTKQEIESPFIGVACRKAIEQNVHIKNKIKEFKNDKIKIGVIGYGSIGSAVYQSIRNLTEGKCNSDVEIIEIDYSKWNEIKNLEGTPNPKSELSNKYDILFGCTGNESFGWGDRYKVNSGALLVSVSSASIEFSRGDFIEIAELYNDDPITIEPYSGKEGYNSNSTDLHADLQFKDLKNGLNFIFINSGFPVNFTGERECLPIDFIEPTHVLLYAACYQVLNQPKQGIQILNEEYDAWIYYNAFTKLKAKYLVEK